MTDFLAFSWKGNDNPNDPSGVATFKVDDESISIVMNKLSEANKLCRLVETACAREKQRAIEITIRKTYALLNESRYD